MAALAHAQIQIGDFSSAIRELDTAIQLAPRDARLFALRGIAYLFKQLPADAVADLSKAVDGNVNPVARSQLYLHRARAYASSNDDRKAIGDCEEAIRCDPNNGDAYLFRARLRRRNLDRDAAISDLSEVIRLSPYLGEAFLLRAEVHRDKGDTERARSDYRAALSLDPALTSKVPPHLLDDGGVQPDANRLEDALRSVRAMAFFSQVDHLQPDAKAKAIGEMMAIGFTKAYVDLDYILEHVPKDRTEYKAAEYLNDLVRKAGLKT